MLESSWNHPFLGSSLWKYCLPWNNSLVPKQLGTSVLVPSLLLLWITATYVIQISSNISSPLDLFHYENKSNQKTTLNHFLHRSINLLACKLCFLFYYCTMDGLSILKTNANPFIWFSSVQLLSCVQLSMTPWTAACQASLFITNSRTLPKHMSIEPVMPPTISSSVVPFSSRLQSFPSESF